MRIRHLALLAAVAVAVGYVDTSSGSRVDPREIAVVTTPDFRAAAAARKVTDSSSAPSAAVTLTITRRVRGAWREVATYRLPGRYFWKTVTGARAVCRLEMHTAGAAPSFRPFVVIQLLLGPSLGCGPSKRYVIRA